MKASRHPTPLPEDMRALLDVEREPPRITRAFRTRVLERIEARLLLGGHSPGSGGAPPSAGESALTGRFGFGHLAGTALVAFAIGGAVGATMVGESHPVAPAAPPSSASPSDHEPAAVPVAVGDPNDEDATTTERLDAPAVAQRTARPTGQSVQAARTPRPETRRTGNLAAERRILDAAQAALRSGSAHEALHAVDRHRTRFPEGQLTEERDFLRILAVHALGRVEEARAATTTFSRDYPSSVFRDALPSILRAEP